MTAYLATESTVAYSIYAYYKSKVDVSDDTIALGLATNSLTDVNPVANTLFFSDSFVESSNPESNYIVFSGLTADSTTVF